MPENDGLRQRIRSLLDDQLLRVVYVESHRYRPEASEYARAEIAARRLEYTPK